MVQPHFPSVLICTPCYGGNMHVGYFRGLELIRGALEDKGVDYDLLITEGESNVNRARNLMLARFMQTDYDVLAFIDADIEFHDGDDFLKLLECKGIRGAAVPMKTLDGSIALNTWKDGRMLERNLMVEPHISVDYIGAAVLMVERHIFSTLWSEYTNFQFHDDTIGPACALFENVVASSSYLSEDYGFCEIARAAGFDITAVSDVKVTHYGQSGVYG